MVGMGGYSIAGMHHVCHNVQGYNGSSGQWCCFPQTPKSWRQNWEKETVTGKTKNCQGKIKRTRRGKEERKYNEEKSKRGKEKEHKRVKEKERKDNKKGKRMGRKIGEGNQRKSKQETKKKKKGEGKDGRNMKRRFLKR